VDQLSFSIVDQSGLPIGNTRIEPCFQGKQKKNFPPQKAGNLYKISNLPLIYRSLYLGIEDTSNRETYQWKSETQLIEPNQIFQWDIHQGFLRQIDFTKHQIVEVEMRKSESLLFSMWTDAPMNLDGVVVSKDKWIERRLVERNGWMFEKIWFWAESVQDVSSSNPFKSSPKRELQTVYTVSDANSGSILLCVPGERYLDLKDATFRHPEIRDVNFDGWPDLIIPKRSDAQQGSDYFAFNKEKGKFMKLAISNLGDLQIDYVNQEISGKYFEYGFPATAPVARVDVLLKGPNWKSSKLTRQDLVAPVHPVKPRKKQPDFRFDKEDLIIELWTTDASDQVILDAAMGGYAQKLRILQKQGGALVYEHFIQGNVIQETGMHRDFLLVRDFNLDGIDDVYFPRLNPHEKDRFALSDWGSDGLHYYTTVDFSYERMIRKFQPKCPLLGWLEWEDYNLDGHQDFRLLGPNDRWNYFTWDKASELFEANPILNNMDYGVVLSSMDKALYWKSSDQDLGSKLNLVTYCAINGQITPDRTWMTNVKSGNTFDCMDWSQGKWVMSGKKYH
jgi:hypothetical protein